MMGATALLAVSMHGLAISSAMTDVTGAYLAFTCAVMIWGWQEMAFLMGFVTGPRKHGCEAGCRGWHHFLHAIAAILYHELAILAAAAMVVALTWDQPNQVGTWTFMILWGMRQSAKLNLHFGVPNLNAELLPVHLQFLRAYLNRRPMNLLFPVSIVVSTAIAVLMIEAAVAAGVSAFGAAGLTLTATMLVLAILEHWFLVLPLPVNALWSWSLRRGAVGDGGADREPWAPGAGVDRSIGQGVARALASAGPRIRIDVSRAQAHGRARATPSNHWRRS
jgi:putative photosynthetic complex assembly protein 2